MSTTATTPPETNPVSPSQTKDRPTYVRAKVLASKLGVHHLTIARWADEGKITKYKPAEATVLYNEDEVFEYIASCGHRSRSIR